MLFHNVAFPYPILDSSDANRDDYEEGFYSISLINIAEDPDSEKVILEIIHNCSVDEIRTLVEEKKVDYSVLIICNETVYRKSFKSSDCEQKIILDKNDFHGRVDFHPQIVAVTPVSDYTSASLNDEYSGVTFSISPGDVIATAETFSHYFEFNTLNFESLVKVSTQPDQEPFSYSIDLSNDFINILMGIEMRKIWDTLRIDKQQRPLIAMSIYKDCFTVAINELSSGVDEVGELKWQKALRRKLDSLEITINGEHTLDEINLMAQKIMEGQGVKKLIVQN